jgi:hypothetical protein
MIRTDNFRKCRPKVFLGNTPVELGSLNSFFSAYIYLAHTSFSDKAPPPLVKKFIGDLGALSNATHLRGKIIGRYCSLQDTSTSCSHICDKLPVMLSITFYSSQCHAQNNLTRYLSYQIPTHHLYFNLPWLWDRSLCLSDGL